MDFLLKAAIVGAVVSLLGAHQLGLFDDPHLAFGYELPGGNELYLAVEMAQSNDLTVEAPHLLNRTKTLLVRQGDLVQRMLERSALAAGAPMGAQAMSVGLFFVDPSVNLVPKSGFGWVLGTRTSGETFDQIQAIVRRASAGNEHLRAVRVSAGAKTGVLSGRIRYRNLLSPSVGSSRVYPLMKQKMGELGIPNTDSAEEAGRAIQMRRTGTITLELYATGANDVMSHVDYFMIFGDNLYTWKDVFGSK